MHRFRNILFVATREEITPALLRAAALARANGGRLAVTREADVGALLRVVREGGHDLVMKAAADGGGVRGRLFGTVDQRLMRTCPCPVWLFDPERGEGFRSVLAAVDVSAGADAELTARVIQVGSSLAAREGAAFHVVHAWSLHSESLLRSRARGSQRASLRALLRETRQRRRARLDALLSETAGVEAVAHLVKGPAAAVIPHVARRVDADVVVMGTAGRAGLQGLLIGNTAEAVLPGMRCSVLTVKLPEVWSSVVGPGAGLTRTSRRARDAALTTPRGALTA